MVLRPRAAFFRRANRKPPHGKNNEVKDRYMVTIKILGTGCPNCNKIEANAHEALGWIRPGCEAEILKVTDPEEISAYVLRTPGLLVNDAVVCEGRVPASTEIVTWIADALADDKCMES